MHNISIKLGIFFQQLYQKYILKVGEIIYVLVFLEHFF